MDVRNPTLGTCDHIAQVIGLKIRTPALCFAVFIFCGWGNRIRRCLCDKNVGAILPYLASPTNWRQSHCDYASQQLAQSTHKKTQQFPAKSAPVNVPLTECLCPATYKTKTKQTNNVLHNTTIQLFRWSMRANQFLFLNFCFK